MGGRRAFPFRRWRDESANADVDRSAGVVKLRPCLGHRSARRQSMARTMLVYGATGRAGRLVVDPLEPVTAGGCGIPKSRRSPRSQWARRGTSRALIGPVVLSSPRHRPSLPYVLAMAVGWAQDGAVQDQIDATVDSAVKRARSRLARGESLLAWEECGEPIPEARRHALPGVRRCVPCQYEADRLDVHQSLYNRRGSKDSQLK